MREIAAIAGHEIRLQLRDFRIAGSLLAVLLVLCPALLISISLQEEEYAAYLARRSELTEQLRSSPNLSQIPVQVTLPPPPLAFLNRGVLDQVTFDFKVSRLAPPKLLVQEGSESWLSFFFRALDVSFLAAVIFGIICFATGYSAFSLEKETGTLRMVLSHPMAKWRLLLGKLVGLCLCLAPAFLLFASLLLFSIVQTPVIRLSMSSGHWWSLALYLFLLAAFLLSMLQIALLVSLLTHRSSNTLLMLMIVWLSLLAIVPGISHSLAEQVDPPAKSSGYRDRSLQLEKDLLKSYLKAARTGANRTFERFTEQILDNRGIKAVDLGQFFITRDGYFFARDLDSQSEQRLLSHLPELARDQAEIVARKKRLYLDELLQTLALSRRAWTSSWLSPPAFFLKTGSELVETGPESILRRFAGLVESYDRLYGQITRSPSFYSPLFFEQPRPGKRSARWTPPQFELGEDHIRSTRITISTATSLIGFLPALCVMLFFLNFIAAVRYDPT